MYDKSMSKEELSPEIRRYLAELGRKGGSKKTAKKQDASRRNGFQRQTHYKLWRKQKGAWVAVRKNLRPSDLRTEFVRKYKSVDWPHERGALIEAINAIDPENVRVTTEASNGGNYEEE